MADAQNCIDCRLWRPRLERPWLDPKETDVGACPKQVDAARFSAGYRTTTARHECDCDEFTAKS